MITFSTWNRTVKKDNHVYLINFQPRVFLALDSLYIFSFFCRRANGTLWACVIT